MECVGVDTKRPITKRPMLQNAQNKTPNYKTPNATKRLMQQNAQCIKRPNYKTHKCYKTPDVTIRPNII